MDFNAKGGEWKEQNFFEDLHLRMVKISNDYKRGKDLNLNYKEYLIMKERLDNFLKKNEDFDVESLLKIRKEHWMR